MTVSHLGELYQCVGGSRDGDVVAATVEPPFEIRRPKEGGKYRTGVLITKGYADDHVLIWEQDWEPGDNR